MTTARDHAPVNPVTGLPNTSSVPLAQREAAAGAQSAAVSPAHAARAGVERMRAVLDNPFLAGAVLALLLLELVGVDNLLIGMAVFVGGYVLVERFAAVRRAVCLGGGTWLVFLLVGNLLSSSGRHVLVSLDYFFVFCGFFMAVSVCAAYFAGASMFRAGRRQGAREADHAIAAHVVDRLIERPDNWEKLDGDYLEVEGALNRVRQQERKSAQALRDEARRKDDLVTYLAHDLKTPLASVVGYLSLLQEAPDLPVEQRAHFTGIALEKAHRLDALIEEFFDITRFDFHDIVLTRGYVDLAFLLAQVADEFYPILSEQGKSARIDVPQGLTVLVDGDKMARVFNNIMKNAIAYSYEGSVITVAARRQGDDSVQITFENHGDPIPEPKLKVIFEKFYRLDSARATNRGGAGLGLAIAREIVVAHGGTIGCVSNPEHTVFTITIPSPVQ